jgi:outer membrane lipoprotein SlyB
MKVLSVKKSLVFASVLAVVTGCAQPGPEATKGALIGGAGAAGITALVGGSSRSIATAAAVGAVAGGIYGDSKDKK